MGPDNQEGRFKLLGHFGKCPCRISIGYLQYPRNRGMEKCFLKTPLHVVDLFSAELVAFWLGQAEEIRVIANIPFHQGRTRDHIDAH